MIYAIPQWYFPLSFLSFMEIVMQHYKQGFRAWLKQVVLSLAVFVCAISSSAIHAAEQTVQDADALLSRSGVSAAIASFPDMLMFGLDQARQQGAPIPDEVMHAMAESSREVFAYETLIEAVRTQLLQTVKPDFLTSWVAFYATPVGEKMALADAGWADVDIQTKVMLEGPKIMQVLAAEPARMALLQSLVQASDAVERTTSSALSFGLAIEWGMISSMPPNPDLPSFDELQAMIEQNRFAMRGQMTQMILALSAVIYQDFSLDELQAILAQVNTEAGQAFYRQFSDAFETLIVQHGQRLGERVGQRLGTRPV